MSEINETIAEAVEKAEASRDTLNNVIAILVAVFATFMALGNIKDGNIVQAMSQDQSKAVDQWSYYQAKGMKQNLAESVLDQLQIRKAEPGLRAAGRGPARQGDRHLHRRASRSTRGRRRRSSARRKRRRRTTTA